MIRASAIASASVAAVARTDTCPEVVPSWIAAAGVSGANPAANAAYADTAFVANRFRVITSRRHV